MVVWRFEVRCREEVLILAVLRFDPRCQMQRFECLEVSGRGFLREYMSV